MSCLVNLHYNTTSVLVLFCIFTVKTPFIKKIRDNQDSFIFFNKKKFNNIINYRPSWVKWGQYYNTLFVFFIIIDLYIIIKTIFIDVY